MVEDEDEVRLDEAGKRDPDRVGRRQRDGRLEDGDRVVGEGAHRAARESRHPVPGLDGSPWDERTQGVQRVRCGERRDGKVGRVGGHAHGPVLDAGHAVAHVEQPARPDTEEAVAA
jgi:hypothetical protein